MRRTRLLHVVWDFSRGGLERLVHDLACGIERDRFETHILTLQGAGHFAQGLEGVARIHIAPRMSRLSIVAPLALTRRIRDIAPDIVHTHSGVWYKVAKASRWAGVPHLVHTDHGRTPASRLDLRLERSAARRTDMVVAVSQGVYDFQEQELGVARSRLKLILNGIDTERFRPRRPDACRPSALPAAGPVLGSVARFDPIKRYDVMLRAFASLLRRPGLEGASLVLIGDGPERERLETDARALGIRERVVFPGWVAEVETIVSWLDVFTLASRSEGTSLSLLEAMSCGVCPVVTRVGGNPDVLGPKLAHRLVEPEDPEALADGWAAALAASGPRAADAVTARARVVETFDLRAMVRRYEDLYADLRRLGEMS